ncbi:plastocyanin/azurin family copper-binding protein [Halobacterium zhouii]|uniref:plastocyanin/azurin family copper-binding protein n=1 Tax=Halobacterium zhouii TaxID=2902624 RepID=UPI001E6351DF|nr:plastocyanin/azurin family copper-binding protein [Halobacterium zhouii]
MNSDADESVSRRGFLRAGVGAATAGFAATGTAAASGGGGSGSGTKTIKVGPGGNPTFSPETAYVKPGTTVKWVWKSNGHNVKPTSTPDGASWKGHPEIVDSGTTYEHTFEKKGTYEYICVPHESMGMTGSVKVTDNPPKKEGYETILPDSAKTASVAALGSMTSVLGISYVFMKYGGDYSEK